MHPEVDRLQRVSAADERVIGLAGGLPANETFPEKSLVRGFRRALASKTGGALQYGWPEGRDGLRAWVAARLTSRGAPVSAEDVIITSGAQQALSIATQVLLRRGDSLTVAKETYPAALDLFRTRGYAPTYADDGAVAYVTPALDNPRGQRADGATRGRWLEGGGAIIEDDAYAELGFDGRIPAPLRAAAPDRVWHVGTFSKTLCPGLRVGWLVPPKPFRERALGVKHAVDLQANSLAQALLEEYLSQEDYDARLVKLRRFYARRAERLARALRKHLPGARFADPQGGFSIWVELDEDGDDTALLAMAVRHGVSFDPGREFRVDQRSSPLAFRVCFSAAPWDQLEEGVRRLARAVREHRRSTPQDAALRRAQEPAMVRQAKSPSSASA